jgi:hypothetical protein
MAEGMKVGDMDANRTYYRLFKQAIGESEDATEKERDAVDRVAVAATSCALASYWRRHVSTFAIMGCLT